MAAKTALTPKSHTLLVTLAGSRRPDACVNIARLLDMSIPVDAQDDAGFTALASAARVGDLVVVSLLLERGASANSRTRENGNRPLFWAGGAGHDAVARKLLQCSADPLAQNVQGDTCLLWACRGGAASTVALLLDVAPSLLAVPNVTGMTTLICAAAGGRVATLRLLLERSPTRVLLDAQDRRGRSALHFSAGGGGESAATCVEVLLGAGCDWRLRDDHGITALGEAERERNDDAASLLRAAWEVEIVVVLGPLLC